MKISHDNRYIVLLAQWYTNILSPDGVHPQISSSLGLLVLCLVRPDLFIIHYFFFPKNLFLSSAPLTNATPAFSTLWLKCFNMPSSPGILKHGTVLYRFCTDFFFFFKIVSYFCLNLYKWILLSPPPPPKKKKKKKKKSFIVDQSDNFLLLMYEAPIAVKTLNCWINSEWGLKLILRTKLSRFLNFFS